MQNPPAYENFAKAVMLSWPEHGIDGMELQELAEAFRMIVPVEGGFDPDKHCDEYGCAEPGDPWFVLNYSLAARQTTEGEEG